MTARDPAPLRGHYVHFRPISTRWMDNDVYGHVNNVVYYSYFDTAVNHWLIESGVLDIHGGAVIGLVVQSQCHFLAPLQFPQAIEAGLRVAHLGNSSVRFELGLFARGHASPAAYGHLVHVYVDRQSRRPCALPPSLRKALQTLTRSEP